MNTALNYIIEANIGLILFLAFYRLLLHRETDFPLLRTVLLAGIFASLLFPLIRISGAGGDASPLSIGHVIPAYWLPEVVVGTDAPARETREAPFRFWRYVTLVYTVGFTVVSALVLFQLIQLFRVIRNSRSYRFRKLRIAESAEDKPTFSFFNFIFIGKAHDLSLAEKHQIIRHESVHARQWHSFDILLTNILRICFWFNPFVNTYKKIFIQLHEFEADARAVENTDVNKYCSLLARVALRSADFTLANHFNNSLTVKRIEMMRTIKHNIKRWKMVAFATMIPVAFFFLACQDQVGDDISAIAENSTHTLMAPQQVQERFEQLKSQNPEKKYALVELNEVATEKLRKLEGQYGLPESIEVFAPSESRDPSLHELRMLSETAESSYSEIQVDQDVAKAGRAFAIIEFNEETSRLAKPSAQDQVFTVVEEQPEFPGGYDSMTVFLKRNLRYPASARQQGIEGTVYVSFIVEKDGAVSDVNIIRGIAPEADAEARRVVEMSPAWTPARQRGEVVRVRFVLPIKFNLSN